MFKVISKELTSSMAGKGQVLCADYIMGNGGEGTSPMCVRIRNRMPHLEIKI